MLPTPGLDEIRVGTFEDGRPGVEVDGKVVSLKLEIPTRFNVRDLQCVADGLHVR